MRRTGQSANLFDDFFDNIDGPGGESNLELKDYTGATGSSSQWQQQEGDLLGLGTGGEAEVAEQENKSPGGEGAEGGENDNGTKDVNKTEHAQEPEGKGEVETQQVDAQAGFFSPASSGYSSIAGVPSEIKERNKQAIIIRAQIYEVTKCIEDLKEEKVKAQGREELDPLSEESTLKEEEIQKAERSLEKLKKRAEKRYEAGECYASKLLFSSVIEG